MRGWCAVLLITLAGCVGVPPRGYYAPVGMEVGPRIVAWTTSEHEASFTVRCQGVYVNEVDGERVRTAHVQLEIVRSGSASLVLPLETVYLIAGSGGERLAPTLAYSRAEPVTGQHVVPGWERRPLDLFFDWPHAPAEAPDLVRVGWRYRVGGVSHSLECQFVRIPDGDPRLPARADRDFGVRAGYYLPGWNDLGERGLRETREARTHYLFHEPGGWFFG